MWVVEAYLPAVCRRHSRGQGLLSTVGFPKSWCWYSLEMHVIRTQSAKEIEVMVIPVNHSPEMANIERILQDWSPVGAMCGAGYKNDGSFQHCSAPTSCPHTVMDDCDGSEWYCSQERHEKLEAQLRNLQYRQPMLNFYWNSRGKSDCQLFLRESGLVTQYRLVSIHSTLLARRLRP